nr:hypothetical protein [Marinicella sp. W31]MDC2878820.1 hypothetical protein [Marinicella sp. W31]
MASFQLFNRPSPFCDTGAATTPLYGVVQPELEQTDTLPEDFRSFALSAGFSAREGEILMLPGKDGRLAGALLGLGANTGGPFITGRLSRLLPAGDWHLARYPGDLTQALIGFAAGCYRFGRYLKPSTTGQVKLAIPESCDPAEIERNIAAIHLARDLINTPANDMQPDHLEQAFEGLADHYGASFSAVRGDDLIACGFL